MLNRPDRGSHSGDFGLGQRMRKVSEWAMPGMTMRDHLLTLLGFLRDMEEEQLLEQDHLWERDPPLVHQQVLTQGHMQQQQLLLAQEQMLDRDWEWEELLQQEKRNMLEYTDDWEPVAAQAPARRLFEEEWSSRGKKVPVKQLQQYAYHPSGVYAIVPPQYGTEKTKWWQKAYKGRSDGYML